ncbi:hypothetical protein B0T16DRAFT_462357 [Cercophora newfieldiana]|uniref:Uncharacterized protein n=1 Tax=Cercophora newfieldiana TaxID=92897 RepID=A0AA39XSI5_9PEZI|nr:hypothetical protein B0T16DRAFT_462357 [Cercophora newfieldiana]
MNYANMIEERRLKQGFILATLISTIAGTFTTGINLYDRIVEKRKQAKLDRGQDDKIRDLERQVNEHHGHGKKHKHHHRGDDDDDDDRLRQSLQYGGSTVRNEYDRHYAELGSRYAEGDVTAQLQLQSATITLQQTVIKVLEEALYTGQPPDISKLYNASEFARQGSVRALRDQYRRMLESSATPNRRPAGPIRRISSTSALDDRARALPPAPSLSSHSPSDNGPLFCPAAVDLQSSSSLALDKILTSSTGAAVCSACGLALDTSPWRVEKDLPIRQHYDAERREEVEVVEVRTFSLTGRFLAKCHRPGGGYACYLCARHRDRDTVCGGVEGLVRHIAGRHGIREVEGDGDVREVRGSTSSGSRGREMSRGRR